MDERDSDLRGARFERVDFTGARMRNVDLSHVRITGSHLAGLEISGYGGPLVVNGVDVRPLVEAELDRLHPERADLRAEDADAVRRGFEVVERLWQGTVSRARLLPEEVLHERVDDEWSFIETLRHLVFVTDAWIVRVVQGDPSPYHPLDLPFDELPDGPGVPRDLEARPTLDEVLALRAERSDRLRAWSATLTDADLGGTTAPVDAPGWPPPDSYPVRECVRTVLDEEWWHRRYAERDLAVLEGRLRSEA